LFTLEMQGAWMNWYLSRCSEFLSYCVGLGLSLLNKETQSGGTFQTDIPCLLLVA